jgi:hypothetical protein
LFFVYLIFIQEGKRNLFAAKIKTVTAAVIGGSTRTCLVPYTIGVTICKTVGAERVAVRYSIVTPTRITTGA